MSDCLYDMSQKINLLSSVLTKSLITILGHLVPGYSLLLVWRVSNETCQYYHISSQQLQNQNLGPDHLLFQHQIFHF